MVFRRGWFSWLVGVGLLGCLAVVPGRADAQLVPGFRPGQGERTVPSVAYDAVFAALAAGDFRGALQTAGVEYQGAIQVGGQRWIDSIAAAAAVGECHFELGNLRGAMSAAEDAMLLATTHADWLMAVQFPTQRLRPRGRGPVATWGRSARGAAPAAIPETMSIRQGGVDPQVLKNGGILSAPVNFPIRPQEIIRSLVIAIYRYGCILGPVASESVPLSNLRQALGKRPAPPNHFSQSWIDVALGMASWSQGKHEDALARFNSGLLVENQFDHPLTSWALIGIGRIALDAGRDAEAVKFFEEATYTAADFGDARALEEAFHWACTAHIVAGSRGVPPSITGAAEWSRGTLPVLHARLLAMQAECLAVAGETQAASQILASIDGRVLRGDPGRGLCGAEAAYVAATVGYRGGDVAAGDRELARAIAIMQPREPRLFRVERLIELLRGGAASIPDRRANELFQDLLGDPPPRSFSVDPLGTLASLTAVRQEAFDAWIVIAARRSLEDGLAAAEATLRGRWLQSQPLGGRRVAVETLISSSPESLAPRDADRRAALLARNPPLAVSLEVMGRMKSGLRESLRQAVVAEGNVVAGGVGGWQDYQKATVTRAALVAAIAAGREPTALVFPPLLDPVEIRRRLRPGEAILSFHWTSSGLTGVLEWKDGRIAWEIKQPGTLAREIAGLARSICLFESAASVPTERLTESEWRLQAEKIERLLFKDSRINLGDAAIKELVIVPDGMLWYVPFEMLPVGSGRDPAPVAGEQRMLRDACLVRYCPTRSLAVDRFVARRGDDLVGVHVGRMHRGDTPESLQRLADRLMRAFGNPVPLGSTSSSDLAASLVDSLVIFEELGADGSVGARPLLQPSKGRSGITFGEWASSPRKQPSRVVLPGFQSALASGLAKLPPRPGDDLFFAVTDLLAAGSRTALVSRWRMAGPSSAHLVEEFVRDQRQPAAGAPVPSAAESWHRAVDIVQAEEPDVAQEPRLSQSSDGVLGDSRHPLFWAGYLLADCGSGDRPEPPAQGRPAPGAKPPQPAPRKAAP